MACGGSLHWAQGIFDAWFSGKFLIVDFRLLNENRVP